MFTTRIHRAVLMGLALTLAALPAHAELTVDEDGKIGVYGDFRVRLERDWDSHESDGTQRNDRTRARVRVRIGLNVRPNDTISFGMRFRSGNKDAQQFGLITLFDFGGSDTGDADANFDKWFLKLDHAGASAWFGRNSIPLRKQNELFWDDDVTPGGLGASYEAGLGNARLTLNGGFFALPAGMHEFAGNMALGQAVYARQVGGVDLTIAGGLLAIDADPDDPDTSLLLDGNGARDYTLWNLGLQARLEAWKRPLTLGFDLEYNSQDYAEAPLDPFTTFHRDERTGYVASVLYGSHEQQGDWLVGYYYAHIETLSANSSYVQDDWLRWGTSTQVRATNFEGHEARFGIGLPLNFKLVGRLFVVDGIKKRYPDALRKEDGKRFRLDLDYAF